MGRAASSPPPTGDTYNFPVEVVETRLPVRVERYATNVGAGGGAGRHRGGFGLIREYRILNRDGASRYASMGGWSRRPWGLFGGRPGTHNYVEYVRQNGETVRCGRIRHIDLAERDLVRIVTGTGGGFGDPLKREVERVRQDVVDGYLAVEEARDQYGVLMDTETLAVDEYATQLLRSR